LLGVLSRMERRGVLIDSDALFLQSNEIANRLSELEEQAYVLAGQPFNLASTKQLQEILFDKLVSHYSLWQDYLKPNAEKQDILFKY